MTNLRKAREAGKLSKFIKEHEADPPGDRDKFDAILKSATQGSDPKAPKASSQDASDD